MTKLRVVLGVQGLLAALAAGGLGVALWTAARLVSVDVPSASALAAACSRFALPHFDALSIAALGLGSVGMAVIVLSLRSLTRQAWATRRFVAGLCVTGTGPGGSVVFAADAPQAFCAGLLRPRVYVSDTSLVALGPGELDAVVAHESHHRRMRDPLRLAVMRAVGDGLFFLPAARHLTARYGALAELAADGAAVRDHGARPLASALLAFERSHPVVVGVSPERVDHLLGDRPAWELPLALIAWSFAVLAAIAVLAIQLDPAGDAMLNLPLLAAQSCMVLMAVGPVALGASVILGARGLGRRGRQLVGS